MLHPLIDIEVLTADDQGALARARVFDTRALLERAGTPEGRAELAEETGRSPEVLRQWALVAEMLQLPEAGRVELRLLAAAGLHRLEELAGADVDELASRLHQVNLERRELPVAPRRSRIRAWVEAARELSLRVE